MESLRPALRRWTLGPLLVLALAGIGCDPAPVVPDPAPDAPELAAMVEAQQRRIGLLTPMQAGGQVELRWRDDAGSHFEFCRGDLYLIQPDRAALDLRKAGERFLFLGCDGARGWLFDLRAERVLTVREHGEPVLEHEALGGVSALAVIDLIGLSDWTPTDDAPVWDPESELWIVEATGLGGPLRLHIEPGTLLPLRIETLDDDGAPVLVSRLEEYRDVDQPNLPPVIPRLPERVRIDSLVDETNVLLSFGTVVVPSPTARPALFELDRLVRILRPERVDGLE